MRSSVFVSIFFFGLANLLTSVSVSIQFDVPNERQRSLCLVEWLETTTLYYDFVEHHFTDTGANIQQKLLVNQPELFF